jgi:LemA protein
MRNLIFKNLKCIIGIVLIIIIVISLSVVFSYNNLVRLDQDVDAKWSEIKNQDQRKVDLIPQLVSLLSGYQEFESSTLEKITALRSGYINASSNKERANISVEMSSMFNDIRITFERYPYLNSIESLIGVQDEIAGTENRIAYSRSEYIDAVKDYNTEVRSFPSNLVASAFGFDEKENLFE